MQNSHKLNIATIRENTKYSPNRFSRKIFAVFRIWKISKNFKKANSMMQIQFFEHPNFLAWKTVRFRFCCFCPNKTCYTRVHTDNRNSSALIYGWKAKTLRACPYDDTQGFLHIHNGKIFSDDLENSWISLHVFLFDNRRGWPWARKYLSLSAADPASSSSEAETVPRNLSAQMPLHLAIDWTSDYRHGQLHTLTWRFDIF